MVSCGYLYFTELYVQADQINFIIKNIDFLPFDVIY